MIRTGYLDTSYDLNNIVSEGRYSWGQYKPSNAPAGYCGLFVFKSDRIVVQVLFGYSDSKVRFRTKWDSTWDSWSLLN